MDRARFELAASSMPRRRSTELIYLPIKSDTANKILDINFCQQKARYREKAF